MSEDYDPARRAQDDLAELRKRLALVMFEIEDPTKNKTAEVTMKTGGKYKFSYADLGAVLASARKVCAKHGLALTQHTSVIDQDGGRDVVITTKLAYGVAEERADWVQPVPDRMQDAGGVITYGRRYTLATLLAIYADDDDDANGASGNAATIQDRRATPAEARKAEIVDRAKQQAAERKAEPEKTPTAGDRQARDQVFSLVFRLTQPLHDQLGTPEEVQTAVDRAVDRLIEAAKMNPATMSAADWSTIQGRLSEALEHDDKRKRALGLVSNLFIPF